MDTLLTALLDVRLSAVPKTHLKVGDSFIQDKAIRTVTGVASEQGSGPRPATVTVTTDDGVVDVIDAELRILPLIVLVSLRP